MEDQHLLTEPGRPPVFKAALESGLIITAILIIYTMILYILDLHMEQWLGYIAIVIMVIALYVFAQKYRDQGGRSPWRYGQALGFLTLTLLIASVLGGVFNYIYFLWIAPETIDLAIEQSYEEMISNGVSESQAEQQMQYILPWMTTEVFALMSVVMSFFWGFLLSLILAAVLKREPSSI